MWLKILSPLCRPLILSLVLGLILTTASGCVGARNTSGQERLSGEPETPLTYIVAAVSPILPAKDTIDIYLMPGNSKTLNEEMSSIKEASRLDLQISQPSDKELNQNQLVMTVVKPQPGLNTDTPPIPEQIVFTKSAEKSVILPTTPDFAVEVHIVCQNVACSTLKLGVRPIKLVSQSDNLRAFSNYISYLNYDCQSSPCKVNKYCFLRNLSPADYLPTVSNYQIFSLEPSDSRMQCTDY